MVKVSVISTTFRTGGIDVLFSGLANQTFKDFELILVDHRYEYRHEQVLKLARRVDLNLIHVPEHRRNGKWYVGAAATNTGIMLTEGEIIMLLTDFSYAHPDWIEAHLQHHLEGSLVYVMAPNRYYDEMPEIVDLKNEISWFKEFFSPKMLEGLKLNPYGDPKIRKPSSGPISFTYCHVKNDSFRTEVALKVGGADENFDKGKGPWDNEFCFRFQRAGCSPYNELKATLENLNPRLVKGFESMPWGGVGGAEDKVEGRWSWKDGEAYQNTRYVEIRSGATPKTKNPYDMLERKKEIWHWRNADTIDVSKLDIPDEEYYRG